MSKNETATVSRRTIAKGTAWSLPVVATAAAAPAANASSGQPTKDCGVNCYRDPNKKDYYVLLTCASPAMVKCVAIDGIYAELSAGQWHVHFRDARSHRSVTVYFTDGSRQDFGEEFFPVQHNH